MRFRIDYLTLRLVQTGHVKCSRGSPIFYTSKKCSELKNSISHCVNACELRRVERAFIKWSILRINALGS